MRRRRLIVLLALLLATAIGGFLWLDRMSQDSRAKLRLYQIECGMTRKQVWELMRDIPDRDSMRATSVDSWEMGGGYLLTVRFAPDHDVEPRTVDERDPGGDNWTVENVVLLDLTKPNPLRQFLARFGLWSKSAPLHKRCK
jgi:hypothetical protein